MDENGNKKVGRIVISHLSQVLLIYIYQFYLVKTKNIGTKVVDISRTRLFTNVTN